MKLLAVILILLNFFHGIFASGFIPILNQVLKDQSTFAFSLYFFGILLGQILVFKYYWFSKTKLRYPVYEVLFGFSLLFMAIFSDKTGLTVGRFIEGIAAGLALPLIFSNVIQINELGSLGKRVTIFNSVFAVGFVLGPFTVAFSLNFVSYQNCLAFFGLLFIIITLPLFFMYLPAIQKQDESELSLKRIFSSGNWFEKFFTLFLAKSFYGFLLAFTTGYLMSYIHSLSIAQVMFIFALIFITGQIITENTINFFPKQHLEVYVPLLMAGLLILFFFTLNPYIVFGAALLHSILAFIGYLNFGIKVGTGREFAFFNSISDPAMVIGSLLAGFGVYGIWGLVLLTPLPLIRFILSPDNHVRAEKMFPFVGLFMMHKITKKQFEPLKAPFENEILKISPGLSFNSYENNEKGEKITFVFTGDFCPSKEITSLSPEVKDFVCRHDFRIINLESPLDVNKNSSPNTFHNISDEQFKKIIFTENGERVFNIISLVNNHVLDLGQNIYNSTISKLSSSNLTVVTSNLQIKEINNVKTGFFGLTFGINLPWKSSEHIICIKPEDLLNHRKKQQRIINMIKDFRQKADILIMSYHWGYEAEYLPSDVQKKCFDILQKAGVDILYGHHSHIIQPYEIIDGGKSLCLYSCGNFISEWPLKVYQQGVLYSVDITKTENGTLISKVMPFFIENIEKTIRFTDPENCRALNNFWEISMQTVKT